MKVKELLKKIREKSIDDLKNEILELRRVAFGLRMQKSTGQLTKNSEIKKVRIEIARIKTIIAEKVKSK